MIILFPTFSYLDHWDYHSHPHSHPAEFENLQETNFTELQSVQALHPPSHIRHETIRYDTENLLDPTLGAHPHVLQQPVSPSVTQDNIYLNRTFYIFYTCTKQCYSSDDDHCYHHTTHHSSSIQNPDWTQTLCSQIREGIYGLAELLWSCDKNKEVSLLSDKKS